MEDHLDGSSSLGARFLPREAIALDYSSAPLASAPRSCLLVGGVRWLLRHHSGLNDSHTLRHSQALPFSQFARTGDCRAVGSSQVSVNTVAHRSPSPISFFVLRRARARRWGGVPLSISASFSQHAAQSQLYSNAFLLSETLLEPIHGTASGLQFPADPTRNAHRPLRTASLTGLFGTGRLC